MIELKVGGVPEHFNLPWHQCLYHKLFEKKGIKVKWVEYKGGTGVMNAALRNKEIDMAVMLTEGIVYDIIKGNPSKIIAQYINTPLQWGIFTGINNTLDSLTSIFDKRFAISRHGSGSHLMPLIDASNKGKQINDNQFIVVKNLEGALVSLSALETDVFYWERYTTNPFVDRKILKYLGYSPTPWPCFVIVAQNELIAKHPNELKNIVNIVLEKAKQFKEDSYSINLICNRHYLKEKDAKQWMSETNWSQDGSVEESTIRTVVNALQSAKLIDVKECAFSDFVYQ